MNNYVDPSFSNRTKRCLINGLGQLSRMFGTAMDEDVEGLRERYNHLASLAANQNTAINMNSLHTDRPEHAVQDITSYSRIVRTALNAVTEDVKGIHKMALINHALPALESAINSVLHTNNLVIQNAVDADRGRVTSSPFPIKDLQRVLMKGEKETPTNPFVCCACHTLLLDAIHPLLESSLTSDAMVIHVSYKSEDDFDVFHIQPFPFSANGSVMIMDLPASVVLIRKDFSLFATSQFSDLGACKTEHHDLYLCSASLFAFLPLTGGACEVLLTQTDASKDLELCPFRHIAPRPLFYRRFSGFHYFFFTSRFLYNFFRRFYSTEAVLYSIVSDMQGLLDDRKC